ncbi:MAG: PD-(D/E)XK nuclease family protein [Paludibacter sp.]
METNIFKILKLETKENYHSKFIVEVINANTANKDLFVKMLEEVIKSQNGGSDFKFDSDVSKLKFETEKTLPRDPNSRVDIYASDYKKDKGKTRIIIENKIYAGDQKEQLLRYYDYLNPEKNDFHRVLFYLTIEKRKASNHSIFDSENKYKSLNAQDRNILEKGKDYFLLSFKEDIIPWLFSVKKNKDTTDKLNVYINDYLFVIDELTKYEEMLETGFRGSDNYRYKYNALLELRFWQEIESKLEGKFSIDYQHRYYNYNKILKVHKPNPRGKMPQEYGLILNPNSESNENASIRIGVHVDKNKRHCLFVSNGSFDNNKWEGKKTPLNIKTNELIKLSQMKKIVQVLINEHINHGK